MDGETMSTAQAAAELSRHFAGALALPQGGGIIATASGYCTYPETAGFEKALEAEAARGIDEANAAELDPDALVPLTRTEEKRLALNASRLERARRKLDRRPKDDEADRKARERIFSKVREHLKEVKEAQVSEPPAAEAASFAPNLPPGTDERIVRQDHKAMDPERAHQRPRMTVLGLKHWGRK